MTMEQTQMILKLLSFTFFKNTFNKCQCLKLSYQY